VTNFGSNSVSLPLRDTIPVERPRGIAITPDGAYVYVTNESSDSVSVDRHGDQPEVVQRVLLATGSAPGGIAITPDGTHAYVTNVNSDSVSVIDTLSNRVVGAPIGVGAPQGSPSLRTGLTLT